MVEEATSDLADWGLPVNYCTASVSSREDPAGYMAASEGSVHNAAGGAPGYKEKYSDPKTDSD